jgi:hypothetical protein
MGSQPGFLTPFHSQFRFIVESMMNERCVDTIHKKRGLYIFHLMQGILSLTMPSMRLLNYSALVPVSGRTSGAAAPNRPALFQQPILENANQPAATGHFSSFDFPPPSRWGLNE